MKPKPRDSKCYYCAGDTFQYGDIEYYEVKKAIKPPFTPHRFVHLGYACLPCVELRKNPPIIDPWKQDE